MKTFIRLIFISLLSSYSFTASSQDMIAMMKQQLKTAMTATCNDRKFLNCAGFSQNKCTSAVSRTIASCNHLFPGSNTAMNDDAFEAHGECIERNFLKNTGVSTSRLDACDTEHADQPAADMAESLTMVNQMWQQHAENVGTDGVTLPLYKNATVMSHFSSGEMAEMVGVTPLSALMMASPDDTFTIANYYRKKLNGFTEHKINDDILFMDGGPKNFDYVKDYQAYVVTPHVLISPLEEGFGVPAGTKNKIEIAYEKAKKP
ncbi:MAG: hypothetical protein L3J89_11570 [Gammaproteobacteria bacterium]|nr:hypothetical protein [Gammaproteobacteria bacterium]